MKMKYEYIKEKMGVLSGYFSDKVKHTSDSFEKLIMDSFAEGYHKGLVEGFEIKKEWIPVSERLPKYSGTYLVTLVYEGQTWGDTCTWNNTFGGRWQDVFDGEYRDVDNVVAWMPLPEPYKESEEK